MEREIVKEENNFEEVQKEQEFQEVEIKKKEVRTDSYFDGGLLELIGWRILAFLITAITLGIATPWAKCMLYSWEYKHTVYNGKRLKFEGTGGELFVQYFKWIFFTIITLGLYLIVLPVRKTEWIISNLHFEDEIFVKDESYFDGKTIQLIGVNILCNILTAISLGILVPFTVCYKRRWLCKHTIINRKKIAFTGRALSLWGKYLLWIFLTIITFGIYGLWLPIKMLKWQTKHTHIKTVGEVETQKDNSMLAVVAIIVLVVLVVGPSASFIISKINNTKIIKNIEKTIDEKLPSSSSNSKGTGSSTTKKKKVIKKTKSSFNPSGTTTTKSTTKKKSTSKKSSTSANRATTSVGNSYSTKASK